MKNEFIPYQQALELKELGFDEPCFGKIYADGGSEQLSYPYKNSDQIGKVTSCSAPLYQQVFRWFREKHNMLANVYSNGSGFCYEYSDTIGGTHRLDSGFDGPNDSGCWDSYEDAEIACILKLIETIKNK